MGFGADRLRLRVFVDRDARLPLPPCGFERAHNFPGEVEEAGSFMTAFEVRDVGDMHATRFDPVPDRTFTAGTDTLPPEVVPFSDDDFDSESHRLEICSPTLVTDAEGRALPHWRTSQQVFNLESPTRRKMAA